MTANAGLMCSFETVSPETLTALSIVGKAAITMSFTGAYVYSVEIFPTGIRNIGLGTCSMCARISGMAAPFVGGPLVSQLFV